MNATPRVMGVIAGNGVFPIEFVKGAKRAGARVCAVCHVGETDAAIESVADKVVWIKVGEFGKLISTFVSFGVEAVAMAGGISRVRLFGGVKLDVRGAKMIARIRSTKDDVVMRAVASELEGEGMQVISCIAYMRESLASEGVLTKAKPDIEQREWIDVGVSAIKAMSGEDIGQLVVVRDGVIVAVEAVEGTDATIRRGGKLAGKGTVVVKFAKPTQDMRFDVPTVGCKTIETMHEVKAKVLAIEAGRTLIMERDEMLKLANRYKIAVIGCPSLV